MQYPKIIFFFQLKRTVTVAETAAADGAANNVDKKQIFKNWQTFIKFRSKINYTQVDHAYNIDVVMLI